MTAPTPIVLTVAEVAAEMRVSRRLVYEMVEAGDIEAFRHGRGRKRGAIRVTRAALDRYLGRVKMGAKGRT